MHVHVHTHTHTYTYKPFKYDGLLFPQPINKTLDLESKETCRHEANSSKLIYNIFQDYLVPLQTGPALIYVQ